MTEKEEEAHTQRMRAWETCLLGHSQPGHNSLGSGHAEAMEPPIWAAEVKY